MNSVAVRKTWRAVEDIHGEKGRPAAPVLRKVAVAVVVANPLAGARYVEDISALVDASAAIGRDIAALGRALMEPHTVQSYGKAALIGLDGEQEHGVAMLTTVFGNALREGVGGGKAWISSFTKRAAPGETIDVPLAHKDALYVRSHYDGMTVRIPDAPLPGEIVIIACFASRGRLNHRCGGPAAEEIVGQDGLR